MAEKERIHNLKLDELHNALLNFQQSLQMFTEEVILTEYDAITAKLSYIFNQMNDLGPVYVKPRWCDLRDAGPGVAVSNFDVQFRDAELARMWDSEYRIRLHLSRNDSHSNETERTNSALTESVVYGQTIEWEFQKLFDGISDDKMEGTTLQEFERHQDEQMKLNAYTVRDEVAKRIDDAPCLKEEIVAYPFPDDPFFFNKAEVYKHHTASNPNGNPKVPGIFYFQKITNYIQKHYHVGQLHIHFLKDRCDESGSGSCGICSKGWIGERFNGIPEPMPDYQRLSKYHYKIVFDISLYDDNNKRRETDNFLPRSNIASAFNEGQLSVDNKELMDTFCNKLIVEEHLVKDSLEH